jgi:hypothetical protein
VPGNADELFDNDDPLRCVWAEGYDPTYMPYSVGDPQIVSVKSKKGEIGYVTQYPVMVNGRAFRLYDSDCEAFYHALEFNKQSHRATRSCIARGITQPHRWMVA